MLSVLKVDQLFIKCKVRVLQSGCCSLLALHNTAYQQTSVRARGYTTNHTTTSHKHSSAVLAKLLGVCVGIGGVYLYKKGGGKESDVVAALSGGGGVVEGLPVFTLREVGEHNGSGGRVWVTYGRGVYDITQFVHQHPGGDKIMMAAGGSIEPFWAMYAVHNQPDVLDILETYRIGNLSLEDSKGVKVGVSEGGDPYGGDPLRHPVLQPASVKPFNAEPPASILADTFITPVDVFYVRNHLPVPDVDAVSYRLSVSAEDVGGGVGPAIFTLDDIKRFPKHTVTAAIQCAGNRRHEMSKVRQVKGLSWNVAAIGNATFTGARLCDVLASIGLKPDDPHAQHIQPASVVGVYCSLIELEYRFGGLGILMRYRWLDEFEGLDRDAGEVAYGASIPFEKGMNGRGDVLLAYEMNGQPLTRDHGYPLRVIVPGTVGARNVKWLGGIRVSGEESQSHWQQNDYKGFSPSVDWDSVDFASSPAIQSLPVTSAICQPLDGDTVPLVDNQFTVKGYAWSGGGNKIVRVDVTADGGRTWHVAELTDQAATQPPYHWPWTLWQITLHMPQPITSPTTIELWVKAVDSSYNTQPENFDHIWNLRGVLGNAYHKINVNLQV